MLNVSLYMNVKSPGQCSHGTRTVKQLSSSLTYCYFPTREIVLLLAMQQVVSHNSITLQPHFYQLFLSKATKMIYLYLSTNMTVPVSSTTKSRSPIVYNLKHLILHLQERRLASPAALLITTSFYYTYHAKFCLHAPLSSMPG